MSLRADIADLLTQLESGITTLTSGAEWQRYLAVQARFHQYSFGNAMLICLQNPEASRVAGYRAWERLGRHVRTGERGIRILAPMRRTGADSATELIGFRSATVFDIAQTDGEELPPPPCRTLEGDAPEEAIASLRSFVTALDFSLEEAELPPGCNGVCIHAERAIRIRSGLAPAQRAKTLAHEAAHAVLHARCDDRQLAELEAESVAFLVMRHWGVESDDYTFGYCAAWAGGGPEAIRLIRESAARIRATARALTPEEWDTAA